MYIKNLYVNAHYSAGGILINPSIFNTCYIYPTVYAHPIDGIEEGERINYIFDDNTLIRDNVQKINGSKIETWNWV